MSNMLRGIMAATAMAVSSVLVEAPMAHGQQAAPAPQQQQQDQQLGTVANETKEQRDARMGWWREARFGMFIHWGLYAVPAGTWKGEQIKHIGEWIMLDAKIPVAEYGKLAEQFNPAKYNAEEWVLAAKNAGMKYIVITSKHHDGFAMFHSQDPYNIYDATPFKRDPLEELAAACKKHDMKLGFYYSQAQDWHHPGGAAARQGHWDPAQDGSMDEYLDKVAVPQVKEILTKYGPVAVLWWDTPVGMNKERAEKLTPLLKMQPQIITNNRLGGGYQGDTETPEQFIPPTGYPGRDWETCMTMNDTWGFKSWDENWKSTERLLTNLIDIASKGGNYLLNVGPTAEGVIPGPSLERMKQIGEWMKVNGDSIYGTSASPFRHYSFDGRATAKGDTLYLHVFKWPSEGIKLVGLKTAVESATFLADGAKADVSSVDENGGKTIHIKAPAKADPIATVVALKLAGPAEADQSMFAVKPGEDGSLVLPAKDATVASSKAKFIAEQNAIGQWTNRRDAAWWDVMPKAAGEYTVEITYAVPESDAGSTFTVSAGAAKVSGKTESTGGTGEFKTVTVGKIHLNEGVQPVMVQAAKLDKGALMNLREVKLTPVK
jgi:alpha-L-fucosidase